MFAGVFFSLKSYEKVWNVTVFFLSLGFKLRGKDMLECLRFLPTRFLLAVHFIVSFISIAFLFNLCFLPGGDSKRKQN